VSATHNRCFIVMISLLFLCTACTSKFPNQNQIATASTEKYPTEKVSAEMINNLKCFTTGVGETICEYNINEKLYVRTMKSDLLGRWKMQ